MMPPARLFALPPGADFPHLLVAGLYHRMAGEPPEAMAHVDLIVNTARMRARVTERFVALGAGFLPRLRLITDLGLDPALTDLPAALPALRRRLELSVLIERLLAANPDMAPRAALFDLADSLATLMDELRGEGVNPEVISNLDVSNHSDHWTRTQTFMGIVERFFAPDAAPNSETRQRMAVESLIRRWDMAPPDHPVIIAGSTGSRGTTALLMRAVARLPRGMVVLPGFDFDLPTPVWDALSDGIGAEDHPQYRFHRLMRDLGLTAADVQAWHPATAPDPARNKLISLSLRPAPVTDQWLTDGPGMPDLQGATRDMTLIEAASPRAEALAIALILRQVADGSQTAALVTPDRGLTRQVTAALDLWGIVPDDSAGRPLGLSAPGRFLRHVAGLFGRKTGAEAVLTILKHPLTATGGAARGTHLRLTREFELWLRRHGAPFPNAAVLGQWLNRQRDPLAAAWANWVSGCLTGLDDPSPAPLQDHVERHLALAELFAAGPDQPGPGSLWAGKAGEAARGVADTLLAEASHGGVLSPGDYRALFDAVIARGEVREDIAAHPRIMIWGTLEARAQGADIVILAGLNDAIWPQLPAPDPWLNRQMRREAGLLLPDRQIGLSAHDYQQAIGVPTVFLTRARRDAEAETVPSRWLNRLTNLMGGLPTRGGPAALADMRARGQSWLRLADRLGKPAGQVPVARRLAPSPPLTARPRELPVTAIRTLIRDPYAIYARYILNLRPLDPLHPVADARLRGTVLHRALEAFVRDRPDGESLTDAKDRLARLTQAALTKDVPLAAARLLWQVRLDRSADFFLQQDAGNGGGTVILETAGRQAVGDLGFTLTGRPDRIDVNRSGLAHIVDYKTGKPPTKAEQTHFDKQLMLLAAMAEQGAFPDLGPVTVGSATYWGLGTDPVATPADVTPESLGDVWDGLETLITAYLTDTKGFSPRLAMQKDSDISDYDHLSRFGEWDMTNLAEPVKVGQ